MLPSYFQIGASFLPKRWCFMNKPGEYPDDDRKRRTVRMSIVDGMAKEGNWTPANYVWFRKKSHEFFELHRDADPNDLLEARKESVDFLISFGSAQQPNFMAHDIESLDNRWYQYYAHMLCKLVTGIILRARGMDDTLDGPTNVKSKEERDMELMINSAFSAEEQQHQAKYRGVQATANPGKRSVQKKAPVADSGLTPEQRDLLIKQGLRPDLIDKSETSEEPATAQDETSGKLPTPRSGNQLPNAQPGARQTGRIGRPSGVQQALNAAGEKPATQQTPDPRRTSSGRNPALEKPTGTTPSSIDPKGVSDDDLVSRLMGGTDGTKATSPDEALPGVGRPSGRLPAASGKARTTLSSGTHQALGVGPGGEPAMPPNTAPRQRRPAPPPLPGTPSVHHDQLQNSGTEFREQEAEILRIAEDTRAKQEQLLRDQEQLRAERDRLRGEKAALEKYKTDIDAWLTSERATIGSNSAANVAEAAGLDEQRRELDKKIAREEKRIEQDRTALLVEKRAADAVKAQLGQKVEGLKGDIQRHEKERLAKTAEITAAEARLKSVETALAPLELKRLKLPVEVREVEAKLEGLRGQIRIGTRDKQKLDGDIAGLRKEIEDLERKKVELLAELEVLQKSINDLQAEQFELQTALGVARGQKGIVEEVTTRVETKKSQLAELTIQVEERETRAEVLSGEITAAEVRIVELAQEASMLLEPAPDSSGGAPIAATEPKPAAAIPPLPLSDALQAVKQKIVVLRGEREQLQLDVAQLKAQRIEVQTSLQTLRTEGERARDDLARTRSELEAVRTRARETETAVVSAEQVLIQTNDAIAQVFAPLKEMKKADQLPLPEISSAVWDKLLELKEHRGHYIGQQKALEARLAWIRSQSMGDGHEEQIRSDITSLEAALQGIGERLSGVEEKLCAAEKEREIALVEFGAFAEALLIPQEPLPSNPSEVMEALFEERQENLRLVQHILSQRTLFLNVLRSQEVLLEKLWKELGMERIQQQLLQQDLQRGGEEINSLREQLAEDPLLSIISRIV